VNLPKEHRPYGLEQNKKITSLGGHSAKVARTDIENSLRKSIISEKMSSIIDIEAKINK